MITSVISRPDIVGPLDGWNTTIFDRSRCHYDFNLVNGEYGKLPGGKYFIKDSGGLLQARYVMTGTEFFNITWQPFTIHMWCKPIDWGAGTYNLLFVCSDLATVGYGMVIDNDTGTFGVITFNAGPAFQGSYGPFTQYGERQLLSCTRDGATCKVYRNAVDITTVSGVHIDPGANTGQNAYVGYTFAGSPEEVYDWQVILKCQSEDQIKRYFQKTKRQWM